jgi:hypothetical protein
MDVLTQHGATVEDIEQVVVHGRLLLGLVVSGEGTGDEVFTDLDVARWDPDVADALDDLRRAQRRGISDDELPGSWPTRARDVLVRTRALATLVQLADKSTGGAIDTREAEARAAVLRNLARVVRRARVAAYNAHEVAREDAR